MNVLQASEGEHTAKRGLAVLSGDARIEAWGNTTLIAFDKANCNVCEEGHVTAGGTTSVRICDQAEADVRDFCFLTACGSSYFTARGQASVECRDFASGTVMEKASLTAFGDSEVTMLSSGALVVKENATVIYAPTGAKMCATVTVAIMLALKDELETAIRDVAPLFDMHFICGLSQMQHELEQGQISLVVEKILRFQPRIETCAQLVQVFKNRGFWPSH